MEEDRVVALEVSSAYHDDMLKELNGVIIQQQKQIEELDLRLKHMSQKIDNLVEIVGDDTVRANGPLTTRNEQLPST